MKKLLALLSAVVLLAAIAVGVLTGKKNALESEVKKLKASVETLTKEKEDLAPLKDTVQALENEKKAVEDSVAGLTADKEEAEKALKAAKEELRKKTSFLARAQIRVAESKLLVDNLKKELAAKEAATTEAVQGTEGDAAKAELAQLKADKAELEAKIATLEAQIEEAKAKIAELEKNAAAAKNEAAVEGKPFIAEAQGFGGPVAVMVTFDAQGKITELKIGDDRFGETQGFGAAALEPAFAEQFIGKTAPLKLENIDAISGATITSQAVVDAINKAAESAGF